MQVADSAATSLLQQERSKIKVRKADDADDESKEDVDWSFLGCLQKKHIVIPRIELIKNQLMKGV